MWRAAVTAAGWIPRATLYCRGFDVPVTSAQGRADPLVDSSRSKLAPLVPVLALYSSFNNDLISYKYSKHPFSFREHL